jgi:hypothetical protein
VPLDEDVPQTDTDIAPRDLPDNAGDPEQVARRKTEAGRRDRRLRDTLGGILSIPDGREWILALLADCNVFEMSFVIGSPDMTAFNEGKRAVGNKLLTEITETFPDLYIKMMRERRDG